MRLAPGRSGVRPRAGTAGRFDRAAGGMSVYVWHDGSGSWRRRLAGRGIGGGACPPAGAPDVLVNWRGDDAGIQGAPGGIRRVLNDPEYVASLRDDAVLRRKLALFGVRYEPPDAAGSPRRPRPLLAVGGRERWAVGVFDMAAVVFRRLPDAGAAGRSGGTPGEAGVRQADPRRLSRIARFAARAVYGAGLDFGVAVVRLEGSRTAVLEKIDPAPRIPDDEWPSWQDALAALAAESSRGGREPRRAILGMDAEFVLVNEAGKVVPASRFFAGKGPVGCDDATAPGRSGVHPLAELRPAPSGEPAQLIRHLRRTMLAAASRIGEPGLRWLAGGMPVRGLALGGHIHFSGVRLNGALVRALDNYLALPLSLLEDETAARRRKRYGRPGDVRTKRHGGFEYRTLPSVIVSPRVTKGAVALAKLIAEHYERLPERPLDDPGLLEAFVSGDKARLIPAARRLWTKVEELDGYAGYARFLDPLGEWIRAGKSWRSDADFRKAWKIPIA